MSNEVQAPIPKHDYLLGHNSSEHNRLDAQHEAFKQLAHGKVVHVRLQLPEDKTLSLLDVGCGTGCVTTELGQAYPYAQVLGVDIAGEPTRFQKPSNVRYLQGDFFDLVGSGRLEPASFDYTFHRLLICGMTRWRDYVADVFRLLKKGGWAEMQEFDRRYRRDGEIVDQDWGWKQAFDTEQHRRGYDMAVGANLTGYMKDAGFEDVQTHVYRAPIGTWMVATHPESKAFGEYASPVHELEFTHRLLDRVLGASQEHVGEGLADPRIRRECAEDLMQTKRKYYDFVVTTGRKP